MLRVANSYELLKIPGPLGVLFESANTISGTSNAKEVNLEVLSIQNNLLKSKNWRHLPGIKKKLASELFGRGYQRITHDNDNKAAEPFIRQAIKLDPTNLNYLKTYFVRCILDIKR